MEHLFIFVIYCFVFENSAVCFLKNHITHSFCYRSGFHTYYYYIDWNIKIWISVAFIPAGLYSIQNIAALTAYQHLDAMTYNVLNQTKTLSAALCCYMIMKKQQSFIQILSLLLLLLSALTIEGILKLDTIIEYISIYFIKNTSVANYHENRRQLQLQQDQIEQNNYDPKHYTHGVLPILLASFISGLAGALSQNNLQGTGGRNIYLFSMELCAASILLLSISLLFLDDGKLIYQYGYWYQWNILTFIPILSNSFGGILVGLVTKYAGSVQKGFALIFGIFLSGIIQAILQPNKNVTSEQWIGGLLAAISLYLHSSYPPKPSTSVDKVVTKTVKKD